MLDPANPADHAFDPHPEAAMRHAAEAAEVEVPLEGFLGKLVLLDTRHQQIVVVDTLAAADDFTVAFGCEHVDAECDLRTLRVRLHIERLNCRRISMHRDRSIETLRDRGFIGCAEVTAPLEWQSLLLDELCRIIVREARERWLHVLEL